MMASDNCMAPRSSACYPELAQDWVSKYLAYQSWIGQPFAFLIPSSLVGCMLIGVSAEPLAALLGSNC